MNKKGYTLVEVVTVIILLSVLMLLIIPPVNKALKKGKTKAYNTQIDNIKMGLQMWEKDNIVLNNNESVKLTLYQLKSYGYIDKNIKNPKTDEIFANDMELIINKSNNVSSYEVIDVAGNIKEFNLLPDIKLNGNIREYVEINSSYNELGIVAKQNGIILNNVVTTGQVNPNSFGTYFLKYSVDGVSIYRTVIVRDTIGPKITFSNPLNMTYNASINYDFKSDITVTDNSNKNVTVEVTHNIKPIPGKYTIKYVAKDESLNETIKTREITIKE